MIHQAIFSSKDKIKNKKVSSAAILLGALRTNFAKRLAKKNLSGNTLALS